MKSQQNTFMTVILLISNILLLTAVIALFLYVSRIQTEVDTIAQVFYLPHTSVDEVSSSLTNSPATDFTLVDTNGDSVTLSQFIGHKPILLSFTWVDCEYCTHLYPALKQFAEQYPDIQVIVISRGTEEENQSLMSEQQFPFPVLNQTSAVTDSFLVPGTPFFYVIGSDGNVHNVGYASRFQDLEQLTASVRGT
jgi:peroxiredoxin